MIENRSISLPKYLQIQDETPDHKHGVVPIGPRFQVKDLPLPVANELDTSRLLGTRIWPPKRRGRNKEEDAIGRGRTGVCDCRVRGSFGCVKGHVQEKKMRLKKNLGPAFNDWRFNEMGEDLAKGWTSEERKKLESIVRRSKSFMAPALKALPRQNRETISNYYFNIIVPRRIGLKTRRGFSPADVNTDNEDDDVDNQKMRASSSGLSRIRKRAEDESDTDGKKYLKGLR